jgi:hypothetical protein
MKNVFLSLIISITVTPYAYAGLSIDTTPVLPSGEVHPSLYFTSNDIVPLQERREAIPYSEWWSEIISKANASVAQNLSSTSLSEEERSKGAKVCAFAYILTEDLQYLEKAKEALLAMWTHPGSNNRRMLEASYHLQSFCEAYDWIQGELNTIDDSIIRGKLAVEAERFYNDPVMWSPFGYVNNWGVKAASALGTVALTISDCSFALHTPTQWLDRALNRINSLFTVLTTDDGLWVEGSHYLTYTSGNMIPFAWHYRNVSDVNLFEDLRPLFDFVLKVRYPNGRLPNIEDAYSNIFPHSMIAPAFQGIDASIHMWAHENSPGFDPVWWTQDVKEVDLFIIHESTIPASPPPTQASLVFPDARVAVLRSGWDEAGLYLYLNGAPDYTNTLAGGVHTHPDPLECILYANKALFLNDAGYGPDGFNDDNRSWYTHPEAHNIILIDGSASQNSVAEIKTFINSEHLSFVEMIAAYRGATVSRSALLIDSVYIVIADHITAGGDKACDLILHGRGEMTQSDRRVTWATTNEDSQDVEISAHFFPATTSLEHKSGLACFEWQHEETNHYIRSHDAGRNVQFLTLLAPQVSGESPPTVQEFSGEGYTGALIQDDLIVFQKDTTMITAEDLQSDARIIYQRKGGVLSGFWFLQGGSILVDNEARLLESSTRVSIAAEPPTEQQYGLQVWSPEEEFELYLGLPDSLWPSTVSLEGVPIPFHLQTDGVYLEMNGEGIVTINFTKAQKGEVVLDGRINILDVVRTVHFIIDMGPPATRHEMWAADVNYDGSINIIDVFEIAYIILSIP